MERLPKLQRRELGGGSQYGLARVQPQGCNIRRTSEGDELGCGPLKSTTKGRLGGDESPEGPKRKERTQIHESGLNKSMCSGPKSWNIDHN